MRVAGKTHLFARQDDWEAFRTFGPDETVQPGNVEFQHLAIEEQQSAQRLVLGRSGHLAVNRQKAQEARDLRRAHFHRVTLAVEQDVTPDPRDVRFFGPPAVMAAAQGSAYTVEQAWFRRLGRTGLVDGKPRTTTTFGGTRVRGGGMSVDVDHVLDDRPPRGQSNRATLALQRRRMDTWRESKNGRLDTRRREARERLCYATAP